MANRSINRTFEVITDMPVRSLITFPREGFRAPAGQPLAVRGHAWSGHVAVARVELSCRRRPILEPGERLAPCRIVSPGAGSRRRSRRRPGAIEIMARATDTQGRTQPLDSVPWNPRGYCNNRVHRVSGTIA